MNYEALVKRAEAFGAFRAAVVDVEAFVFDPAFREMCEKNLCGSYGQNWSCPPDAGEIHALIAQAKSFGKALVYQTVHPLEDSFDFEGMTEGAKKHNALAQEISRWSQDLGITRRLHLGAGGCGVCALCAKRTGEPCRHPEKAMKSLEAYGVNVSRLAEACGMKYINGQNTVTYFGALLFCEEEAESKKSAPQEEPWNPKPPAPAPARDI